MEKKEFAFENDYVKLKNPTKEEETEIIELIKENKSANDDGIATSYHILKKLCIPKVNDYDFNKYSLEEFKEMLKEAHCYKGLTEIMNEVAIISSQITIHELQYIVLGIRQQKVNALLKIIQEESEGFGELSKEMYLAEKENKKMKEFADEYRKNRLIKKEIESMNFDGADN